MIDALRRLLSFGDGGRTAPAAAPGSVSEWDEEQKRAVGKESRFRCASCDGPEFRRQLFLTTALDDTERIVPLCASCLSDAGRGEEATDERRLPRSLRGEHGFLIDPEHRETQRFRSHGERETMVIEPGDPTDPDDEDDAYMGRYPRKLVEQKHQYPREKLWVGHGTHAGLVRRAGAPFGSLFRHVYINGIPGMGKSVLAGNMGMQHIWSGYGLCVVDPHNSLVDDFLRRIPAHRRDDVVLIEPSPGDAERIVGLNLLEVEPEPGDDEYGEAVDEAIDIIVSVLRGGEGWGTRMGPICENLCRAMILSEDDYTFVDFRSILLNAERREAFAQQICDEGYEFVAEYTTEIAQMDQEKLDSLVRRLNRWVESRLTREIVAHAESSVSFEELIDDDAIILVRNDIGNDDVEEMIATGILRRIWQVVRNRPEADRSPFFFIMDEAHEVLSPEMEMGEMLTGARKFQFGLVLMSQYLNKIDVDEVKEAISEVCDTVITFRAQGNAADYLAEHYEISKKTIKNLPNYHALTTLARDGKRDGPFEVRTFAPYPPLRTKEEAREWIVKPSLERYGVERLSDETIRYRSFGDSTVGVDETISVGDDDEEDPFELTTERLAAICQAVFDESIDQERDDDAVQWDERLTQRLTDYHDAGEQIVYASHKGALFDSLPLGDKDADGDEVPLRCWEDEHGEMWLQVTSLGQSKVFETGTAASSGGPKHRKLLRDCYRPFASLGGDVNLPSQTGESMPDGSLAVDWQALAEDASDEDIDWPGLSADERDAIKESLREPFAEDYPLLAWLTDGREVAIEAESSTGDSKGGQTARNVAEAVNAAQRCLLLCREHTAEQVWNTLTSPPYLSEYSDLKHGKERLYNLADHTILNEKLLRPAGAKNTVWIHDLDTDEYVLKDSDGDEHNRFATPTAVFEDAGGYPWSIDDPDGDAEIPDDWTTVKRPFVPEYDFDDGIPDRDAWEIIIVESGASEPDDLAVYRDGDTIPLTDIRVWEQQRQAAEPSAESQAESSSAPQVSDETAGMLDDILDSNGAQTDD